MVAAADVDAFSAKVPQSTDSNIIVFGERLFWTLSVMSNLAAWQITKSGQYDDSTKQEVGIALAQIFAALHAKRKIEAVPPYMVEDVSREKYSSAIHFFSVCFVIAHEFAHIDLGHLKRAERANSTELKRFELQADTAAARMTRSIRKIGDSDFSMFPYRDIAPLFVVSFFSCMDLMMQMAELPYFHDQILTSKKGAGNAVHKLNSDWEASNSHPASTFRFDNVVSSAGYEPGSLAFRFSGAFFQFLIACMHDVDEKADAIISEVTEAIREGRVRPSDMLTRHARRQFNREKYFGFFKRIFR